MVTQNQPKNFSHVAESCTLNFTQMRLRMREDLTPTSKLERNVNILNFSLNRINGKRESQIVIRNFLIKLHNLFSIYFLECCLLADVSKCDNLPLIIGAVLGGILALCILAGLITCIAMK